MKDPLRIEDSAYALLQQKIGATAIEDTPKHSIRRTIDWAKRPLKIHVELKIRRAHTYSNRLAQRPLKIQLSTQDSAHKRLGATTIEDTPKIEDSACALLQQEIGATAIEDTPKHSQATGRNGH